MGWGGTDAQGTENESVRNMLMDILWRVSKIEDWRDILLERGASQVVCLVLERSCFGEMDVVEGSERDGVFRGAMGVVRNLGKGRDVIKQVGFLVTQISVFVG